MGVGFGGVRGAGVVRQILFYAILYILGLDCELSFR